MLVHALELSAPRHHGNARINQGHGLSIFVSSFDCFPCALILK
jgi:hypothetical protein